MAILSMLDWNEIWRRWKRKYEEKEEILVVNISFHIQTITNSKWTEWQYIDEWGSKNWRSVCVGYVKIKEFMWCFCLWSLFFEKRKLTLTGELEKFKHLTYYIGIFSCCLKSMSLSMSPSFWSLTKCK